MTDSTALRHCALTVIQSLRARTGRVMEMILQETELTALQTCVLVLVANAEAPLTVGDISQQTGVSQANTSALCKKLETDGYLTRTRSEADRRVVLLALTDKGTEAVSNFQAAMDRCLTHLDGIPKETLEDLGRGIHAAEQVLDYLYEASKSGTATQEES